MSLTSWIILNIKKHCSPTEILLYTVKIINDYCFRMKRRSLEYPDVSMTRLEGLNHQDRVLSNQWRPTRGDGPRVEGSVEDRTGARGGEEWVSRGGKLQSADHHCFAPDLRLKTLESRAYASFSFPTCGVHAGSPPLLLPPHPTSRRVCPCHCHTAMPCSCPCHTYRAASVA